MKNIAISLLALAACSASAQSSVAIYGVVDSAIVRDSGGPNGSVTKISGGAASGSRLGFRGSEDLGGGLSANFVLESGINVDDGTLNAGGGLFGRQAFVGLSGKFGAVTIGRQYSLVYLAVNEVADPFKTGSSGRANNVMNMAGSRINNTVRYTSPSFHGFSTNVMYGAGEVAGRAAAGRHLAGELAYAAGPLAARLLYTSFNDAPASVATPLNSTRIVTALASWQFKSVKLHAGYALNRNDTTLDSRDAIAGLTWVHGVDRFVGSVIVHSDRSAGKADVDQYALGAYHALSRRTDLYFIVAQMRRENALAARTFFVGNASDAGSGNRGINLGMRHSF